MNSGSRFVIKTLGCFVLSACVVANANAADEANKYTPHYIKHGPNHLSVFIGGTDSDDVGTEFTVGLDYEYRVTQLLGLGGVVEYAAGGYDATTLLTVADIHLWEGLAMQVGPGVEFSDGDETFVFRVGGLWEVEYENFTLSPQVHYDIHDGEENTVVFGLAIGKAF